MKMMCKSELGADAAVIFSLMLETLDGRGHIISSLYFVGDLLALWFKPPHVWVLCVYVSIANTPLG